MYIIRKWLKKLRNARGITTYELSKETGISQASISAYELGVRNPTVKNAKKIAAYFGVEWQRFFEDEEQEKSTAEAVHRN